MKQKKAQFEKASAGTALAAPMPAESNKLSDAERVELGRRLELGKHIVADPQICHGKPTYRGTRIMVWQILEALADGESVDDLVHAWDGRVSREAILESIRLAKANFLNDDGKLKHREVSRLAA